MKQADLLLVAGLSIGGKQVRALLYQDKIKGSNWITAVREKFDDPNGSW